MHPATATHLYELFCWLLAWIDGWSVCWLVRNKRTFLSISHIVLVGWRQEIGVRVDINEGYNCVKVQGHLVKGQSQINDFAEFFFLAVDHV